MLVCAWQGFRIEFMGHSHWHVRTIRSRRPAAMSKTTQPQVTHSGFSGDFDFVTPNTHICSKDKGVMILVIIKGRSPNMSHVSKTYRVDLDCFLSHQPLEKPLTSNMWTQPNRVLMCWPRVRFRKSVGFKWHTLLVNAHFAASLWSLHLVTTGTCRSDQEKCPMCKFLQNQSQFVDFVKMKKKRWIRSDEKGWSRRRECGETAWGTLVRSNSLQSIEKERLRKMCPRTQLSKSWETFRRCLNPRNRVISKAESHSCRCSTT